MIVLAIVCGVFAGFAARRFLSARDAWDFWRLRRATLPGLRGVFYRDARRSLGWALGAVALFFLVVPLVWPSCIAPYGPGKAACRARRPSADGGARSVRQASELAGALQGACCPVTLCA